MNRPFVYRGRRAPGVFQRCRAGCPLDGCTQHQWGYAIELPTRQGGRRTLTKSGYATGKAAMEARADVAKAHRDGKLPDTDHTLSTWLPEWLDGRIERKEVEDSTARGYRDNIDNHLIPELGHRKLGELRGLDLTRAYRTMVHRRGEEIEAAQLKNRVYAEQAETINAKRRAAGKKRMLAAKRVAVPRPLSPATVARIHACLSAALKSAVKAGLIPRNPAPDADLPKVERRKVRPPEPEQYGAFLDQVESERLYPLWHLAGHSGLRRGELAGLKWEDVDLATGRVVVRRQRVSVGYKVVEREAKTEAGQDRVLFVDADTIAVLKTWRKTQMEERLAWGPAYSDGGYIVTREDGTPYHPDFLTKSFSRTARRCGMPGAKLHTLRHFRASALIATGADIALVSKAIGHKNISVTSDIYGHLFEAAAESLAKGAAGFVPRARKSA